MTVELLAHGGTVGLLLEGGLPLVVLIVFATVYLRERRNRDKKGEGNDRLDRRPLFRDEEGDGDA